MKKIAILGLFTTFLLAACGQSGPLYLPESSSPDKSQQSEQPVEPTKIFDTDEI